MLSCARITVVPSLVEVGIAHTNDSKLRLLKRIALMLTHLHLKGFKSWRDTGDIDLRPITGLFGTNSSGKTSVLQALLLLKQTAESPDRATVFNFGSEKTPVDLGSFRDVAHAHDVNNILEISIDWKAQQPLRITDLKNRDRVVVDSRQMGFTIQASQRLGLNVEPVSVDQMWYRVNSTTQFGMAQNSLEAKSGYELFAKAPDFHLVRADGRAEALPAPDKYYGFPAQVRAYFQNTEFVADLELALEECLRDVYYLGPLRAHPERRYTWSGTAPTDMGRAGESVVDAILASRERGDTISGSAGIQHTLEQYVAHWLKKLGLIHAFRVARLSGGSPVFEVRVRKSPGGAETLITEVGFGVSQILPVLVLCFYVPEGSTVILEQPDIHLHPSVQAGLADVLIDVWRKRKVQIILESHSEHLLRRLRLRVAEEEISETEVGLYFCTTTDHESALTTLQLDSFGNITNWPPDFFGDEFGEIVAMSKAVLRRRRKDSE